MTLTIMQNNFTLLMLFILLLILLSPKGKGLRGFMSRNPLILIIFSTVFAYFLIGYALTFENYLFLNL